MEISTNLGTLRPYQKLGNLANYQKVVDGFSSLFIITSCHNSFVHCRFIPIKIISTPYSTETDQQYNLVPIEVTE